MIEPVLIGVTGNIACGKSVVMSELAALGATTIDGDLVYRDLTGPSSELGRALADQFGPGVLHLDGSVNRPALGAIIFSDAEAMHRLDELTHPAILQEIDRRIDAATTPVIAVDGIKLLESGLGARCDQIWVVDCDPEIQLARLQARNQMTVEEAGKRIRAQSPAAEKRAQADVLILNNGTLDDLRAWVSSVWNELPQSARDR